MPLPPPAARTGRIAPTPSGFLHPGNLLNFLLNARLTGKEGRLFLRVDDLDRARFRPEYLADIFRVVDLLDLPVTDGPRDAEDFARHWSQTTRMYLYRAALDHLPAHPLVFPCACSRRELATGDHPHGCLTGAVDWTAPTVAWRVDTRALPPQTLTDAGPKATERTVDLHATMPFFALRRKDGNPAYQLTSVVDDRHFGINVVARGEDLVPSTAAQSVVCDLLDYPPLAEWLAVVHHPLITGSDGIKLSKSAGAAGVPYVPDEEELSRLWSIVTEWA